MGSTALSFSGTVHIQPLVFAAPSTGKFIGGKKTKMSSWSSKSEWLDWRKPGPAINNGLHGTLRIDLHLQPQGHVSLKHAPAGFGHSGYRHLLLGSACYKKGEVRGKARAQVSGYPSLPFPSLGWVSSPGWGRGGIRGGGEQSHALLGPPSPGHSQP